MILLIPPSSRAHQLTQMPKDDTTTASSTSDILLAGALAAFTVDILIYPLDTLKTRFQSKSYASRYLHSSGSINRPALFRGLYQGIASVVIATLPSSGAFFLTYESAKYALTSNASPLPTPIAHSAASAIAELVSCAILTPAEVIKQNAQMASSPSSSSRSSGSGKTARASPTVETLRRFRTQPSKLFRGYFALAARNLPFTALQFPMFEWLREQVTESRKSKGTWKGTLTERAVVTGVSAGLAGSVAAVITTPVDVVKTRVMLAAGESDSKETKKGGGDVVKDAAGKPVNAAKSTKGSSEIAIVKEVWKEGGIRGLFRGGGIRAVWTMAGSGLYLGVYDLGRVYLAQRRGKSIEDDDLF